YMTAAHDVPPDKKSADNLLEIVLEDRKYCEDELGIVMVGYCTDNGGDAKGMRVRLKRCRMNLWCCHVRFWTRFWGWFGRKLLQNPRNQESIRIGVPPPEEEQLVTTIRVRFARTFILLPK
ncbi:hypothetical protein B0H13DRAFT_1636906, partial [Mycena leptocephala]